VDAIKAAVDGLEHVWTIGHTLLLFRPSREKPSRYPLPSEHPRHP
jgi:RNA-binding protein